MDKIVPRLLMKASPGPVTRKKPAANNHIVESVKKIRVSVLRSQIFLRVSWEDCHEEVSVAGYEEGGVRVP